MRIQRRVINRHCIISLAGYLLVYFLFLSSFNEFSVPQRWKSQFSLLLFLSFCASLPLVFTDNKKIISISLVVRFVFLLIMGYPLGANVSIEIVLLSIIFFDLYFLFPLFISLPTAVVVTLIVFLSQWNEYVWTQTQEPPEIERVVLAVLFVLGFNMIMIALHYYREREWKDRNTLRDYENTVQLLIDANVNLQENITREIRQAENNERKRIAREIHDILGHSMVNIMMISESIKDKIKNNKETIELLNMTRNQAETVLHDTENSMRLLKNIEQERKYDIIAIKRLADIFQKATNIQVILEFRNVPFSFGKNIDRVVYRIIQECMTNAFRHGKATEIKILFWKYEKEIEIIIMDNGVGSKHINEGIGLWGIRERLSGINGRLTIANTARGFEIYIRFPWNGEE